VVSKEKLLIFILEVAEKAGVKIGIGGGIAVNTWGYRRETADVDAFFHENDRKKILETLHSLLPEDFMLEELDRSHWMIVPEGNNPDERIDLLFALGDPEESAIEMTISRKYRGISVPVFPVDLLVVCKFLADRDEPKDVLDIHTLLKRGAYRVEDIETRLLQMGLTGEAQRFPELIEYLQNIPRKK